MDRLGQRRGGAGSRRRLGGRLLDLLIGRREDVHALGDQTRLARFLVVDAAADEHDGVHGERRLVL